MSVKHRPVVRSFKRKYTKEAAAYVRSGGHAIVWENDTRAVLVFQSPSKDNPDDFGAWAVYDMGKWKWHAHDRGAFKGLATTLIPRRISTQLDDSHVSRRRRKPLALQEIEQCLQVV